MVDECALNTLKLNDGGSAHDDPNKNRFTSRLVLVLLVGWCPMVCILFGPPALISPLVLAIGIIVAISVSQPFVSNLICMCSVLIHRLNWRTYSLCGRISLSLKQHRNPG